MPRVLPLILAVLLAGCQSLPNPSFPLDSDAAKDDLDRMTRQPRSLQRPLVILGGFVDLLGIHRKLESAYRRRVVGGPILAVGFIDCGDFEACRRKLLAELRAAMPDDNPDETIEVDVVGYSMGGLIARYAAAPPPDMPGPRLRIKRLFTISTPHRGAKATDLIALGSLAESMKPDSPFMHDLLAREAATPPAYELFPYIIRKDGIIGDDHAAPEGDTAWWVDGSANEHLGAPFDPRIRADILRRLRGEQPFSTTPRAPLPAAD